MNKFILFYFLIINILSFITMYIDKKKSIKNKWRVKESTLFLLAILGGSVGSITGMYTFRHKTKHITFIIGIPLILIMQIVLIIFIKQYIF
ncbi:MAG: DUF1294 domain-containing protein [Clostridium sp.]|nr:DUF1294 domain-containing protein [Clostridium sp.]